MLLFPSPLLHELLTEWLRYRLDSEMGSHDGRRVKLLVSHGAVDTSYTSHLSFQTVYHLEFLPSAFLILYFRYCNDITHYSHRIQSFQQTWSPLPPFLLWVLALIDLVNSGSSVTTVSYDPFFLRNLFSPCNLPILGTILKTLSMHSIFITTISMRRHALSCDSQPFPTFVHSHLYLILSILRPFPWYYRYIPSFALSWPSFILFPVFILLFWQPFPRHCRYTHPSPPQFTRHSQLRTIPTLFPFFRCYYRISAEWRSPYLWYPTIWLQQPLFIQRWFHPLPHPFNFKHYHLSRKFSRLQAGSGPNSLFAPWSFSIHTWHHPMTPHEVHHQLFDSPWTAIIILPGTSSTSIRWIICTATYLLSVIIFSLTSMGPTIVCSPCYSICSGTMLPVFSLCGTMYPLFLMRDYVPVIPYAGLCTCYSLCGTMYLLFLMRDYVPVISYAGLCTCYFLCGTMYLLFLMRTMYLLFLMWPIRHFA